MGDTMLTYFLRHRNTELRPRIPTELIRPEDGEGVAHCLNKFFS